MFKKKGGPAFKPKIPSARSRPVARPAQPTPTVEVEAAIEEPPEVPIPDVIESTESKGIEQENTTEPAGSRSNPSEINKPPSSFSKSSHEPAAANVSHTPPRITSTDQSVLGALPSAPETTLSSEPPTNAAVSLEAPAAATGSTSHNPSPTLEPSGSATPGSEETSSRDTTVLPQTKKATAGRSATETEGEPETSARPKKRQRRAATQDGDAAPKPRQRSRRVQELGEDGQPIGRRRGRSLTPEDAETQTVDLQKLKMADLTKDLHIGKKFSRHDELRERERQKRIKAKLEKDGEGSESPGDGADSLRAKEQSATPSAPAAEAPSQAPAGPQFRIVDGQIVVDQNSLAVDRHARAAAARAGEDMETVEENDFTRLITSNSFMNTSKLRGPNVWTEEETVMFYRGLAMFGTDFEIISKMIPGKQRRHVKLKFNREERHCPRRVNAALVGEKTVAMDMEEYKAATGAEFEPVEVIEAEQKKIEDGYEAERQRIADEQAEEMRKKKEELFADEDVDMAGMAPGKKKKKKGKKKRVEYGLNGEPIAEE